MMIDLENNINSKKNGLTLKIKVKHQGQVPENEFFEILDLEYVRFDTKIESIAGIQPEIDKQGHMRKVYDLEFQGQPSKSSVCFQHF